MGMSVWQLIIIAVIIALLFGTKKLRGIGGDLGSAIKGFKKAMNDDEVPTKGATTNNDADFDAKLTQHQTTSTVHTEKQKDQEKV